MFTECVLLPKVMDSLNIHCSFPFTYTDTLHTQNMYRNDQKDECRGIRGAYLLSTAGFTKLGSTTSLWLVDCCLFSASCNTRDDPPSLFRSHALVHARTVERGLTDRWYWVRMLPVQVVALPSLLLPACHPSPTLPSGHGSLVSRQSDHNEAPTPGLVSSLWLGFLHTSTQNYDPLSFAVVVQLP